MPQTQRLNDELNVGDFISASHLTNSISFFRNFGESKEDYLKEGHTIYVDFLYFNLQVEKQITEYIRKQYMTKTCEAEQFVAGDTYVLLCQATSTSIPG